MESTPNSSWVPPARRGPFHEDDSARSTVYFAVIGMMLMIALFAIPVQAVEHATILEAIRTVESSGREGPVIGDNGKAIGPYQIHEIYWRDACSIEPALAEAPNSYESCHDRDYAERVVRAYMERWAPRAWARGDAETIARIHNGGPRGAHKDATLPYWAKVEAELRRILDQ